MLEAVGFAMIALIILLLLKGWMTPIVVLIIVPFIAALILNPDLMEISGYIRGGVTTTMNTAILLFFSVIFFGLMSDVGVFDVVVNWLVKLAGENVVLVTGATAIVAIISHLDGATATTVLITVPSMWPIYKRLRINPLVLLTITASGMGVMNLVPWGGPTARVATVLKMDPNELWHMLIPIQIVGAFVTVGLALFLGMQEKRRLAKLDHDAEESIAAGGHDAVVAKEEKPQKKCKPLMLLLNILLIIAVIYALVDNVMHAYVVFLVGVSLALIFNFYSLKAQDARIKAHAPAAFVIGATMIAAGAMVGIMNETGMMNAMATTLINIIPTAFGKYIHMIFGIFALPLGMMIGTDAYFYGIFPLVAEVGNQYGVTPLNTGLTMIIGKNVGLMISPLVPATYLALGLVDAELKDHIKFSFKYLMAVSLIMLFMGVVLGVIQL